MCYLFAARAIRGSLRDSKGHVDSERLSSIWSQANRARPAIPSAVRSSTRTAARSQLYRSSHSVSNRELSGLPSGSHRFLSQSAPNHRMTNWSGKEEIIVRWNYCFQFGGLQSATSELEASKLGVPTERYKFTFWNKPICRGL